jgi:membrane protease YdiL (CAAX protease family)
LAASLFLLAGTGLLQLFASTAAALGLGAPERLDLTRFFFVWLQLLEALAFFLATLLMARGVDHEPLSRSGFRPPRGGAAGIAIAVLFAAAIPATAVAGAALSGTVRLGEGSAPSVVAALALGLPGLSEEILARGYLLHSLSRSWLRMPGAVVLSSAFFGLLHAANPSATPLGIVNVTLAGLFLASVLLFFDSIWAAIAAHAAFNLSEGFLLGLPVSGLETEGSLLHLELIGPGWATGGQFGPEESVVVGAALLVACAALGWLGARRRLRPKPLAREIDRPR